MAKTSTVEAAPAAQPAAPNQIQISPLVHMEEELLLSRAINEHYRNRNLALAQTLANQRGGDNGSA